MNSALYVDKAGYSLNGKVVPAEHLLVANCKNDMWTKITNISRRRNQNCRNGTNL